MFGCVMWTVLIHVVLLSPGVWCSIPVDGGPVELPWRSVLCCDSAHGGGDAANETKTLPRCRFRNQTTETSLSAGTDGVCVDVVCRIEENWAQVTCGVRTSPTSGEEEEEKRKEAGLMALSLLRLNSSSQAPDPVVCEADDSFVCSVALGDAGSSTSIMLTVNVSDAAAPPVLLRAPAPPVKPSPPFNLSHFQTIDAELILQWDQPPDAQNRRLGYEVRYSSNSSHPDWQVASAGAELRLSLDLKPSLNYSVQVRCCGPEEPRLWSDWSERHHIYLHLVSFLPQRVVARPGEDVTVHCIINDHSVHASNVTWMLNIKKLDGRLSQPVNRWVSRITVRASENRVYDLLQCSTEWNTPYSKIFIQGASIDINCVTNGDLDAMDCSWNNTGTAKLQSRWADISCDEMERRDAAGEEVGQVVSTCHPVKFKNPTCNIRPLRQHCYKLWLEDVYLGSVRSKPVYLSPGDYVKPHPPTQVKAVSRSGGVLLVTWKPPPLPVDGLQCRFQYMSPSTLRPQQEWKVGGLVSAARAEVWVPDMCRVYVVQVQCTHANGSGYSSEWSDPVYSSPLNSRAPERGPNFWRILQDDPHRNQTNVTLLFKDLPVSGRSHCVDGFIVRRQTASGAVSREWIESATSHSFDWNQEPQTVSVEAYNSLGSSSNNVNITLDRRHKRRCVRSFRVTVVNSTCVSLSWTLLDNSSIPVSVVVQWAAPQRPQRSDQHPDPQAWARLPHSDRPVYLRGDFFGSEEYGFYLYPVFADGEGEPAYTRATRGDPAAYVMLMIISFLSIVLFVTLLLSQNQMKKFVWKDVPNPNKCSWAKGLDFKKADTLNQLCASSKGLPAWPQLLPSETFSKVVIMDQVDLSALVQTQLAPVTSDPAPSLSISCPDAAEEEEEEEEELLDGGLAPDALTGAYLGLAAPVASPPPDGADSSAQSSVTYATLLPSDALRDSVHLLYKGGSGSSSSDEGNFSANNSDISGSFHGGLWKLDGYRGSGLGGGGGGGDPDDPRRSCSYNSVEEEELSEEDEARPEKDLFYLGMDYPAEDEESEEDEAPAREEPPSRNVVSIREDCGVESRPLLGPKDSRGGATEPPNPLYLPQFRTAPCTWRPEDDDPQP